MVLLNHYIPVYVYPQIDALGEVVEAVKGRVEVYLDGGVRQGTDVLKALALGAKAVFIGRPVLWGLSYQVCMYILSLIWLCTIHVYALNLLIKLHKILIKI